MKRVMIYTTKNTSELADFAKSISCDICSVESEVPLGLVWRASNSDKVLATLLQLIHKIAMNENPVYRNSPKLASIAEGLVNSPIHNSEIQKLKDFLRISKVLNLDGYIMFCTDEYRAKLDLMLYTIVKKINASKQK